MVKAKQLYHRSAPIPLLAEQCPYVYAPQAEGKEETISALRDI